MKKRQTRKRDLEAELIPLAVPEVRRLVLELAGPTQERNFRLGCSLWRRTHQAMTARCRAAKHTLKREGSSEEHAGPKVTTFASEEIKPTDAEWEHLRPAATATKRSSRQEPTERPSRSARRHPLDCPKWLFVAGDALGDAECSTAYRRWRTWAERGLWQRILETLGEEALPGLVIKGR